MSSIDQQFVDFIVKSLVSKPEAVHIERRIDEKGVLLELTVDPEDLGRVIGKRGATAQSLRTLLRALGTKNDARYNLKIVDNGEPRPESYNNAGASALAPAASQPTSSSSDDHSDGDSDDDYRAQESSSVVSKTRKELEEFDDLDV
ncbi:MAG TPA: KH domain-containing protein [Patescibacteria group bacterium]|nr:KH domain-containing protein [Patescibacteria group bacterium]